MNIFRSLSLSLILLSLSSCATAYWTGVYSGAIEANNGRKIFSNTTTAPVYIAIDAAGLPFLIIVLLTNGDGWPTQEEYRKGYDEGNKTNESNGGGEGFEGIPFLTPVFK